VLTTLAFRRDFDPRQPYKYVQLSFPNFNMRNVVKTLLCFLAAPSLWAAADPIILDNPDATFDGPWTLTTAAPDKYGANYKFASTAAGSQPGSIATFRPNIAEAGKYHVDIWYSVGANRATNTPFQISYDGGVESVTVNQQNYGGKWVRIASNKPFAAGQKGFVRVMNNSGATGSIVVVDAMRFVPAVPGAPEALTVATPVAGSIVTTTGKKGYTLNLSAKAGGHVQKSPEQSKYAEGSVVTLTAVADEGYVFDGWTGDFKTLKNPVTIAVDEDKNLTANFVQAGIGVIMDNNDSDVEFSGEWQPSAQAYRGTRYESHHSTPGRPNASAFVRYFPTIPKTGHYDVYVWYAAGENRSTGAPWSVSHKGGVEKTKINQRVKGGEWVPIASGVQFEAGKKSNQYAELSAKTEDSAVVVIADAVAFVYVGQ
jgi:uncharacterized repeat protein (TIGR02543 family)